MTAHADARTLEHIRVARLVLGIDGCPTRRLPVDEDRIPRWFMFDFAGDPKPPIPEPPPWMADSACSDHPAFLFFPDDAGKYADDYAQAAVEVCDGCPVRDECRDFAAAEQIDEGVWGGELLRPTNEKPAKMPRPPRERHWLPDAAKSAPTQREIDARWRARGSYEPDQELRTGTDLLATLWSPTAAR